MRPPSTFGLLLAFLALLQLTAAKVQHKVHCNDDEIEIEIKRTDDMNAIYLDGLKFYPDPACKPTLTGHQAIFRLPLSDIFKCAITRIINEANGLVTYYHRVVIEKDGSSSRGDEPKDYIQVKCYKSGNHTIVRRNVLPAGFQEPIDVTITSSYVTEAPQPKLQVGVRQAGRLVSGELNVTPGTPLQMEIYLDEKSAPIYGLLVSYMQVSDTKSQEETIIFNGCSVDPYLFENFNTVDGDFLAAKFRAFKFPDSTYVQFKGTVNVCLDKCKGVECSNGQTGYGRRKREIPSLPPDPNKVFEISITSFIKVDYKGENNISKVKLELGNDERIRQENQTRTREVLREKTEEDNSNDLTLAPAAEEIMKLAGQEIREGLVYTVIEETNSASRSVSSFVILLFSFIFVFRH